MNINYMVIGGYGQVGTYVCRYLKALDKQVLVAGRSEEKCRKFALNQNIAYRKVDVNCWDDKCLEQVQCVIMCLENNNEQVLKACIRNHVNYVDITPSNDIMEKIRKHKKDIMESGISVCIGVGIAPGISNILCEKLTREFDEIDEINSYLMLGVGESHGKNAVQWLINNLNVLFYDNYEKDHKVWSFSEGRNITFPEETKKQRFVRIDLADWHIMKEKHAEARVSSWYAYDMNSITYLFEMLQKIGFLHLLKYAGFKRFFTKFMSADLAVVQTLHIGSNKYASLIEVAGKIGEQKCVKRDIIRGEENSKITARVCALTAVKLCEMAAGFYYMDEILNKSECMKEIL